MSGKNLLLGQVIEFLADPFICPPSEAFRFTRQGSILVEGGVIADVGDADRLTREHRDADICSYTDCLLLPGFIDPHVHYPQTAIIASWGERLLQWLTSYTFPEESRFSDPDYAACMAARYLDLVLSNGTTTVCSYCTIHPESVDAVFEAAEAREMRVAAGKVCMDSNAPDSLRDDAAGGTEQSRLLIRKWHGRSRLSYAISPRFAVTSSQAQLEALGELWQDCPGCLVQTHISEQVEEVAEVARLFPDSLDYLDVYDSCGLLGRNSLLGHAIHLQPRELKRIGEVGAPLIHCPTSNTFVGSGLFRLRDRVLEGHRVGLATDTGGGSSFSMLRTMAAAYEISQLNGRAIHPGQLLWLATEGNANVMNIEQHVGSLRAGREADILALDLASTPAIAQRAARADDIWEALFPTIMMGDDRAIRSVWVNGKQAIGRRS